MDKRLINSIIIIAILFCGASSVSAETKIPNLLNVSTFGELLENIATGVGTLIAGLGVIMLIIAGILYLTSAGSPEKIGTAKKALIYAIAGIVIGLLASAIVEIIKEVLKTK